MPHGDDAAPDDKIKALWEAVRDLPPAELEAYLASNSVFGAVRKQVESVLDRASDAATHPKADPMIGTTVAHYEVIECIGEGGMGRVYRATDVRLRRTVALKLLRGRTSDDRGAKERLLVEARAAAALDHPNICTIYEVGETAEHVPFIAMAHYPGETLDRLLVRGPLSPSAAIDFATQIARGLGAAHARGIIHRDVKPANIIITWDGVAKLLDFGVARIADADVSREGVTPGTIAYMSPEQVAARPIDFRTDLWSLGVVLYEMFAGRRPFGGDSLGAVLNAIAHTVPASPSTVRRELPADIDAVIARLLAKDRTQRHRNADHLIADLARISDVRLSARRMTVGAAVEPIAGASAGDAGGATATSQPAAYSERKQWVRRARYGVAALAVAAGMAVWPLTRQDAGGDENPAVPGPTEDELLRPENAGRSMSTRDTTLSERRLTAMDFIEQGRTESLFRTDSGRQAVLRAYRKAIEADSTFALAHAAMAICLAGPCPQEGQPRRERLALAERHAKTALGLDSLLPDAHAALAMVRKNNYQLAEAEQLFKRAIDLDTGQSRFGTYSAFLIEIYVFTERPRAALEQAQRFRDAVPTMPNAIAELARGYLVNGRCDEALVELDRLTGLQPPPARTGSIAAQCHAQRREWPQAIRAMRRVAATNQQAIPRVGYMLARAGQTDSARAIRDTLIARHGRGEATAFGLAIIHAGLGDFDRTFYWLDQAYADRSLESEIMEPMFDDVRRDPRFDDLRRKLGFQKR